MSEEHIGEAPRANEQVLSGTMMMHEQPVNPELAAIQNFQGKYPRQIWALFFTEMWERFCFYGNRGMLTIFISEVLLQQIRHIPKADAEGAANLQYGAIQAFVYAFTFIGGIFADKILGFRKSLLWGGLLMITGSFILGYNPEQWFYPGICFLIIGTGFFKPNISTMVGELYRPGDARRDAGFSLFYSGINIGALFGGAACIWVATKYSWNLAFALSGIFMIVGLTTFLITKKWLGPIGEQPAAIANHKRGKLYEILVYAGALACLPLLLILISKSEYTDMFMYIVGPAAVLYIIWEMRRFNSIERQKLIAAFVFIIFSVFFWAFYEQSGGSLSLFARDNLHHNVLGLNINPNVVNNSANSLFIILFSPLVGLVWIGLARKKAEPNTVIKFGLGFLFLAAAFYLFYACRFYMDESGKSSLNMFTLAYFVITFGELCLSPIGLSLMTKLSPKPLWGMMMGMWFLASAYGQYAAGILGKGMSEASGNASLSEKLMAYTDGYRHLAIYALIAGAALIIVSPLVRKLMHDVK